MKSYFPYPLPQNAYTLSALADIRSAAEELYDVPITALPYTTFKLFHETGSRTEYEAAYMLHRKMLCAFCGMVLSGEDNRRYLPKLCDILWAICDEYTWALPAHLAKEVSPEKAVTSIDLFAAETGMALSEILSVVGHLLPEAVSERVRYELNRRIVSPYRTLRPRFGKNNWSAVCACGVGATILHLDLTEIFEEVKDSLLGSIRDFIDGYPEDGCCLEGSLYWAYGFGFFCYFAELLFTYSNGAIDYFSDEKVKKIAFFGPNSYLDGKGHVISFSDSPHFLKYDRGLWQLLAKKYPGFPLPDSQVANRFGDDCRYRFAPFIRNLYWGNGFGSEKPEPAVPRENTVFYDRAGWYIAKRPGYAFAAKAGSNNESHNHNDVGSFLFLDGDAFILDDVGWAAYTKGYFDPEKRYKEIPCTASFGHSVPMADGCLQQFGEAFRGQVLEAGENRFSLEFSQAYGAPVLTRLERTFTLLENGIRISDAAKGTFQRFTERFVTRIPPEIQGNAFKIGGYLLSCSRPAVLSVSSFVFSPRFENIGGTAKKETAYQMDFNFDDFSQAEFLLQRQETMRL